METLSYGKTVKRITLIRPGAYPEGLIVPLGLLYLAGYLISKVQDIDISIVDAALEDLGPEEIAEKTKILKPDLIGLTGLIAHTGDIKKTAKCIRKLLPETVIVGGGPAMSSNHLELLKERAIDFGVIGEGEETFFSLLKALREDGSLSLIDGLVYRGEEDRIILNNKRGMIEDIDTLPRPAYHLIKVEDYFNSSKRNSQSPVYISKRNLPIMTSRGCPFKCIYCHNLFGKKFRPRSPENVVDEIIWLKRTYNMAELEIIDDIFNFDKERAKEIMRKIIDEGLDLKISFPNGIKYETIDDELLELFKKAGVYRLAFGIESGNERVQKVLRKVVDLYRMREIIDQVVKMGFFVSGFFQLGLPGETKEEMLDTIKYAASTKLHTATFHLTIPFPGTQMHTEYVKGKFEASHFESCRDISVNVSAVSDHVLLKLKRYALYKFYFDIKRMISIYKVFPVKKRIFSNFINVLSEICFRKWLINT